VTPVEGRNVRLALTTFHVGAMLDIPCAEDESVEAYRERLLADGRVWAIEPGVVTVAGVVDWSKVTVTWGFSP
jgi:hypothetical protein